MKHFIKLLVPPRGMLLELGSGQAAVISSLKPSIQCKVHVNLLSIYDKQEPVNAFNKEATKLRHARLSTSSKDEE